MTYIPVGTYLTYTATVQTYLAKGYSDYTSLAAQLKNDLPNLDGQEDIEVEQVSGTGSTFSLTRTFNIYLTLLNNGVDHGDENDIKSIVDGTIEGYGNGILSSSITKIQLPGDTDGQSQTTINTGAPSNAAPPATPSANSGGGLLGGLKVPSLGNVLGTTGTITSGIVILLIAVVALVLLLPGGFGKAISAVRR